MKQISNWNELDKGVEVVEFNNLKAGAYYAKIISVEDKTDKEYLEIKFDIADGEFKGEAERLFKQFGNYPNTFIIRKSYKQTADKFFRAFITAIEKSNANKRYVWNWDEQTLVGKFFVAVMGEEEYLADDGTVKVALKCVSERSIDAFKNGEIKTPELKKLKASDIPVAPVQQDNVFNISDDDLPF